jgi:DNA-binding beta-propeller fold protein YncE
VADERTTHRMQVFDTHGTFVRAWGSEGHGQGQFNGPNGVAVSEGRVYVADQTNNRVQVFGTGGTFLQEIGSKGKGQGQLMSPNAVCVAGGLIFVTDCQTTVCKSSPPPAFSFGCGDREGTGKGSSNTPLASPSRRGGCT